MKYRPYCWLGENQDAHVADYRREEQARESENAWLMQSMFRPGGITMLDFSQARNDFVTPTASLIANHNRRIEEAKSAFMHGVMNAAASMMR